MFVYKTDSLRHRLRLDRRLGFWLDYWLFLHGEETHPVWSARPLGFRAVADAAVLTTNAAASALRKQLKSELNCCIRVANELSIAGMPSTPVTEDASPWPSDWMHWLEQLREAPLEEPLLSTLPPAVADALGNDDLHRAAFLTRALAAALGEADWTDRYLFIRAKRALCDSGAFDDLQVSRDMMVSALEELFTPTPPAAYNVTFRVAPTAVPESVVRTVLRAAPQLITQKDEEGASTLIGLGYQVAAIDPEHAASRALEQASNTLALLRLRFYVRTHLCGAIDVEHSQTNKHVWLSLPQPFWTKQPGRRAVPRIPARFDVLTSHLSDDERERWYSARWHLSRAFSDWTDDIHAAAALVWQALEAFVPPSAATALPRVQSLVPTYLGLLAPQLAGFLATKVSMQVAELKRINLQPDWYYWVSTRVDLTKWLGRVFHDKSINRYGTWTSPPAPPVLFDEHAGLLRIAFRRLTIIGSAPWMETRLRADLALLYWLRNKVVHEGTRVLPKRMATYLAQLGAEMILTIMHCHPATAIVPAADS